MRCPEAQVNIIVQGQRGLSGSLQRPGKSSLGQLGRAPNGGYLVAAGVEVTRLDLRRAVATCLPLEVSNIFLSAAFHVMQCDRAAASSPTWAPHKGSEPLVDGAWPLGSDHAKEPPVGN